MYTASDDTPVSVAFNADTNTTNNVSAFKVNYEETEVLSMPVLRDDHQQHSTNNATAVTSSTTTTTTRLDLSTRNRYYFDKQPSKANTFFKKLYCSRLNSNFNQKYHLVTKRQIFNSFSVLRMCSFRNEY